MDKGEEELEALHIQNKGFEGNEKLQQEVESTDEQEEKPRWTMLLALAGYAATIGTAVPAGYAIGVMNNPAAHMRRWCNESFIQRYDIHLNVAAIDVLWSLIVSIFLIGGAIGSLSGAWTANKIGRKASILVCGILFVIAAIFFYCCRLFNSVELLFIGRLTVGLAAGLTVACLPMYLSEIAPLALRGTLGVFCAVGTTAGCVISQAFSLGSVFGSETQWHIALSFYVALVFICFIPYSMFPESPKWLYAIKGDQKAACLELTRLRTASKSSFIAKELESMEIEARDPNQNCGFKAVVTDPKLLLPLILVCAFHGGQQLSGINAIFNYSVSIFGKAGLSEEAAEWANLSSGSLNLMISLMGPFLMAKCNRRPLMLFSSFFCFFALLSFAIMLHFIEMVPWFAEGCIGCMFIYIFFYQFGVGPIPYFIGAELFEVAPRSVAMSLGSLSNFMGSFITCMAFPSLQNAWGAMVFLPFAIICVVIFFLTLFYLPETRGRDPSDVAATISKGFKSKINK